MSDVSSPKASRQSRPRWLDPKLFLGILLVLTSMAVGARVVATADDKVPVLVAAQDISENADLTTDMFEQINVGFETEDDANLYVRATDTIPPNTRTLRPINQGELLPRDAMTQEQDPGLADMAIPVGATSTPAGLAAGDLVDVWVVPDESGGPGTPPNTNDPELDEETGEPHGLGVRVLTRARVMASAEGGGFATGGDSGASNAMTVRFSFEDADFSIVSEEDRLDQGSLEREMEKITELLAEGTVFVDKHVAPKPLGD